MTDEREKYPQVFFASDRSVLIKTGDTISEKNHETVHNYFDLFSLNPAAGTQSIHPAYNSILLTFDPAVINPAEFLSEVKLKLLNAIPFIYPDKHLIEIPVCYDEEFAPDISIVANHNSITVEKVIEIHCTPEYLVYFLGFSPGFPYLGGMSHSISTPRLQTPRIKVPEGSVAIGGDHTGIYPLSSPGGWNIIGRTPLKLFSPEKKEPTLLKLGYKIKFIPISKEEFFEMKNT